jgi:hypothetical protein
MIFSLSKKWSVDYIFEVNLQCTVAPGNPGCRNFEQMLFLAESGDYTTIGVAGRGLILIPAAAILRDPLNIEDPVSDDKK